MATRPFPVLCDRCGAEGLAGEAEFERLAGLGDLLDFEPVPRRVERADGWTPDIQRAFVAALAVTGSERQAAAVVERAAYGVTQLRGAEGNAGFLAACAEAMEIYRERERVRRSDGLVAAARGEAARTRGRPRLAWSGAATRRLPPPEPAVERLDDDESDEPESAADLPAEQLDVLFAIIQKYRLKLEAERRCRLEGRIAEADFYLRQITMLEVSLDVVSGDGMEVLKRARLGDHGLLHIAETGWSIMLDGARRRFWEAAGEPPRPEYPPRHLLEQHDGYATEPLECVRGGPGVDINAERRRFDEQYASDARAQVEWEEKARREAEEWRARIEREQQPPTDDPPTPADDAGPAGTLSGRSAGMSLLTSLAYPEPEPRPSRPEAIRRILRGALKV